MPELLEFLQNYDEAFRSRSRLASLYSDFRFQRTSNPDGYQANSTAWLRALTAGTKAGLIPSPSGTPHNTFVLHSGEELSRALQTQEFGRPLALGAAIEDAVRQKDFIQLREFLDARGSVYAKSWVSTPWQVMQWTLRQLGVGGGEEKGDGLVSADFVVMGNVEAAAKTVLEHASKAATSNASRVFSRELFASTFASALGSEAISRTDLDVLLTHLSRDRSAISYSATTGIIKIQSPTEATPSPITPEDVSIARLRSLISTLEPQTTALTTHISQLDSKAREAVATKQLVTAKSALRAKKLAETKLQQRTATLTQLEDVYAKIEQAADQVEIVKVMEASSQTLKRLNAQTGGVERVQDVMDGLREEMTSADEIGQAINDVSAGEVDEEEVDGELEAMERVEREKVEEAERKQRERRDEVERVEREKKEAVEAEETRMKLTELDKMVKAGTPVPDQTKSSADHEKDHEKEHVQETAPQAST